jgi:hypothetical protein
MYPVFQSCSLFVVRFLIAVQFRRGRHQIAQHLEQNWVPSVTKRKQYNFFLECAAVRTTSGSSPADSCPLTGSTDPTFGVQTTCPTLQHLFFCSEEFGLESSGLLSAQRLFIAQIYFATCFRLLGLKSSGLLSGLKSSGLLSGLGVHETISKRSSVRTTSDSSLESN